MPQITTHAAESRGESRSAALLLDVAFQVARQGRDHFDLLLGEEPGQPCHFRLEQHRVHRSDGGDQRIIDPDKFRRLLRDGTLADKEIELEVLDRGTSMLPFLRDGDQVLVETAVRQPRDEAQLLAVPGVGPAKLEKYGASFLARIADVRRVVR